LVVEALRALDKRPVSLSGEQYLATLQRCVDGALVGGAVHDALIAAAARESGLRLVSLDQRAVRTYATMGVDHQLLRV
jgi:predicted nucleic acid-binding protein